MTASRADGVKARRDFMRPIESDRLEHDAAPARFQRAGAHVFCCRDACRAKKERILTWDPAECDGQVFHDAASFAVIVVMDVPCAASRRDLRKNDRRIGRSIFARKQAFMQ